MSKIAQIIVSILWGLATEKIFKELMAVGLEFVRDRVLTGDGDDKFFNVVIEQLRK